MTAPRLFLLTPGDLGPADAGALLARAAGADRAGVALLLREPGLFDGAYLELARRLAGTLVHAELWLHDRPHLVSAAGARGVHVGFRSLEPAAARGVGGCPVGLSTHAHDDPASWAAADHLFHGPVRRTPSKDGLLEPVGLRGLARACAATDRPVYALGGVRPEDVGPCLASGAHGVAVLGGAFGPGVATGDAAARYLAALDAAVRGTVA